MKRETVGTRAVSLAMKEKRKFSLAVSEALMRFHRNDWGDVSDHDKKANDADYKNRDGRVLAKYGTPEGSIYITLDFEVTDSGRDVETVMFCDEY